MNKITIKNILIVLGITLMQFQFTGCYEHFPLDQDLTRTQNTFLNQDSVVVQFPKIIKDNISLLAMVYTNCPDICPMTTHNMQLVEQRLPAELKDKVKFVVISFDPHRDTPNVLKKFAEIRDITFNNWSLLSGDDKNTKEVMLKFGVKAIMSDSSYDAKGELSYDVIHTDRISLIDQEGKLRANYKGSTADYNVIIEDIKYLSK
ncbi:MAG: SCO family protein [Ignavibacteriaceae bacterium]|nr:SCO family protein [Ignavibacteriaceae bacterium]HRN26206.1 SCO family protein [Ignavibacteriaceae bacterium]HRP92103.1 SCO family protein [Ignavibacteriaceae bacterium]HRQ53820.1 SCO family protein [Ignavibacteriaceae bacterium]